MNIGREEIIRRNNRIWEMREQKRIEGPENREVFERIKELAGRVSEISLRERCPIKIITALADYSPNPAYEIYIGNGYHFLHSYQNDEVLRWKGKLINPEDIRYTEEPFSV